MPVESQISDEGEDDEEEEDEEEEEEEEDDDADDEEAAEEYGVISAEVSDGGEESEYESFDAANSIDVAREDKLKFEEFKWQRVERICRDVREFGEGIIDANELASVYNFRIDKFQVNFTLRNFFSSYYHFVITRSVKFGLKKLFRDWRFKRFYEARQSWCLRQQVVAKL